MSARDCSVYSGFILFGFATRVAGENKLYNGILYVEGKPPYTYIYIYRLYIDMGIGDS